ncbi:MAG: hypothetical protein OHK0037_21980 [Elainellaceae cyanobacterium]
MGIEQYKGAKSKGAKSSRKAEMPFLTQFYSLSTALLSSAAKNAPLHQRMEIGGDPVSQDLPT